jgi:membrane protease YdiL (CAAX protease family)
MRFRTLPLTDSSARASVLWSGAFLGMLVGLIGVQPLFMPSWPAVWLLAGAPVVEEVIFRLGVQHELLARWRSPAVANVLTALVFALAHGWSQGTWQSLLTLLPALFIGSVYQRSRRVLPCIALHAAFNAIWLAVPAIHAPSTFLS